MQSLRSALDALAASLTTLVDSADRACASVLDRLDLQYVLYPSSFGVALDPWFRDSQVVQLYNVHGSYFSHSALPVLSRRRPLVWRLSDMWALTGQP